MKGLRFSGLLLTLAGLLAMSGVSAQAQLARASDTGTFTIDGAQYASIAVSSLVLTDGENVETDGSINMAGTTGAFDGSFLAPVASVVFPPHDATHPVSAVLTSKRILFTDFYRGTKTLAVVTLTLRKSGGRGSFNLKIVEVGSNVTLFETANSDGTPAYVNMASGSMIISP